MSKSTTLASWSTYVEEATKDGDRSLEFPITEDECYTVEYPTRARGRLIAKAQAEGDTDALVRALLGDEAGSRVLELSEDFPSFVLDELLIDVLRKFGMMGGLAEPDEGDEKGDENEDEDAEPAPKARKASTNGHVNGVSVTPGKPRTATKTVKATPRARKSSTTARKSSTSSRRTSAA